jgi:hypothetical protein
LYFRTGPSLVVGDGGLAHTIETGWLVQGGGRSLFFNVPRDRAWTIDLSVSSIFNNGNRPNLPYPVKGPAPGTPAGLPTVAIIVPGTTSYMNRTYINVAFGREWYLLGPANNNNFNWRAGLDGGGSMGTERLDVLAPSLADAATGKSGFVRRNDVISAMFAAIHSDVEIPFKSCVFLAGVRAEWFYSWSDIIPAIGSNIANVNLLYTGGIRY